MKISVANSEVKPYLCRKDVFLLIRQKEVWCSKEYSKEAYVFDFYFRNQIVFFLLFHC